MIGNKTYTPLINTKRQVKSNSSKYKNVLFGYRRRRYVFDHQLIRKSFNPESFVNLKDSANLINFIKFFFKSSEL